MCTMFSTFHTLMWLMYSERPLNSNAPINLCSFELLPGNRVSLHARLEQSSEVSISLSIYVICRRKREQRASFRIASKKSKVIRYLLCISDPCSSLFIPFIYYFIDNLRKQRDNFTELQLFCPLYQKPTNFIINFANHDFFCPAAHVSDGFIL